MSGSLGSLDWGLSYYYGHYKQPSANLEKNITSLVTAAAKEHSTEVAALAAQLIANGYDATTATTLASKKIGSEYASTLTHDGTYELVVYIAVVEEYCLCSADNTEGIAYAALAVDRGVEMEAEGLCDCLYSPIPNSVS